MHWLLLQRMDRGRQDLLVLSGLDKASCWLMQLLQMGLRAWCQRLLQMPLLLQGIGASLWMLILWSLGGPATWPCCLLMRSHARCNA